VSPVRTLFIAQLYLAVGVKERVHYNIIRFCVNRPGENPQIAVQIFGLRDESRLAMNVAGGAGRGPRCVSFIAAETQR
jgi:hypothetical protein